MSAKRVPIHLQAGVATAITQLPPDLETRSTEFLITLDAWRDAHDHIQAKNTLKTTFRPKSGKASDIVEKNLDLVVMAVLDGEWHKITGHSRDLMWRSGRIKEPVGGVLRVKAFRAFSLRDLDHLYQRHANPLAHAQRFDHVNEAMKKVGMEIGSKNLKHGYFAGALNYAIRGCQPAAQSEDMVRLDPAKALHVYRAEIEALDELGLKAEYFSTGVLAAALVTTSLHPEAIDIWAALNANSWLHDANAGGYDAAGIISQVITQRRGRVKQTRSPVGHQFMFKFCLAVVDAWAKQRAARPRKTPIFKSPPAPVKNASGHLEAVRQLADRGHEKDLFQPPPRLPEINDFFPEDLELLTEPSTGHTRLDLAHINKLDPAGTEGREIAIAMRYALNEKKEGREATSTEIRRMAAALKSELRALNSIEPKTHLFTPGITGAALASLRISKDCLEIWENLNSGAWTRSSEGDFDAAGILYQMMTLNKEDHLKRSRRWDDGAFGRAMMVIKTWIDGWEGEAEKTYRTTPRALADPGGYIQEAVESGYTFSYE